MNFVHAVIDANTLTVAGLVLLSIGAFPGWPHSKSWGYGPSAVFSGGLAMLLGLILFRVL